MPYNFVPDGFQTKKLYSRLSSSDFTRKTAILRFWTPILGLGQRTIRLIEKRVVDFLLVLIELFC